MYLLPCHWHQRQDQLVVVVRLCFEALLPAFAKINDDNHKRQPIG